jgi:hypothetical protein
MDIKLLAGSVDMLPASEVNAEYISLVPYGSQAIAPPKSSPDDTAYPSDNFVWSASASEDGTFSFYSIAQKGSGNERSSSQWGGSLSPQVSGSDWYMQNAIFQYALHASMPTPTNGCLVNLYA